MGESLHKLSGDRRSTKIDKTRKGQRTRASAGIILHFDSSNRLKTEKKVRRLFFLLLLFNSICVQRHDILVISRQCLYMTGSLIFTFKVLPH